MSNASARREGTGEALGRFALTEPGRADESPGSAPGGGIPYREMEARARGRAASMDRGSTPRTRHRRNG